MTDGEYESTGEPRLVVISGDDLFSAAMMWLGKHNRFPGAVGGKWRMVSATTTAGAAGIEYAVLTVEPVALKSEKPEPSP